jgi:hypothetical protein
MNVETDERTAEQVQVERWRLESAQRVGVDHDVARKFARGDGDLNRLRELVAAGCAPNLAARIA